MTHLGLSAGAVRLMCDALLHFLWEGTALALMLAAALAVARRAVMRYALGVATLALMLAAPAVTFMVLRQSTPGTAKAAAPFAWNSQSAAAARPGPFTGAKPVRRANGGSPALPAGSEVWLLEFWLAGVALFSVRALGGVFVLERLRRRETRPVAAALEELGREIERRLGLRRAIRYCACLHLDAPAVIGWLRPVVMLPASALTGLSPAQLRAVVAHELAHIRRHDAFVNLFQTGVESLLFYHPAVWWVSARIRAERENCCDDVAVSVCGGIPEYARALVLMEAWRHAPRLAMAANRSPLRARVLRLLGMERRPGGVRTFGLAAASLCLALGLMAGTGLLGTARGLISSPDGLRSSNTGAAPAALPASSRFSEALRRTMRATRAVRVTRTLTSARLNLAPERWGSMAEAQSAPSPRPAPQAGGDSAGQDSAQPQPPKESYIGGLSSLGFKDLSADQLIALKVQGVTTDYIRQILAAGLKPSVDELIGMKVQGVTAQYISGLHAGGLKPTVDELIAMKVQQVTPEYVSAIHAAGFTPTVEELIGMKVQGVTSEYISAMQAAGFKPSVDELIGMKVQGVSPEYISAMRAAGVPLTGEEAIAMRVQGVTPEYIRDLRAEGVEPKSDEIIALRVQGVTPEYVRQMHAAGLKPSTDDLIAMKVQGVSPEYIRDMHAAGLSPTADQLIAMRTQGVTPEYVKALDQAGLGKLSTNDYITAKVMGISPEFIEKARSHGITNLNLDKLIALKQAGVL